MNHETTLGEPNAIAIAFFLVFIAVTLGITFWASRRTKQRSTFTLQGAPSAPAKTGLPWPVTT